MAVFVISSESRRAGVELELECDSNKDALGMSCSSGETHASLRWLNNWIYIHTYLCITISNKVQTASVVTRNSAKTF